MPTTAFFGTMRATNSMKRMRLFLLGLFVAFNVTAVQKLPNILWITSEDNGPELGCYGDKYSKSPNLDGVAAKGMMYLNCWSTAPVCAIGSPTIGRCGEAYVAGNQVEIN